MFSSDHLPLTVAFSNQNRRSQASQTRQYRQKDYRCSKTRLPPIRNWQPNDNWYNAISLSTLSWQDWEAIPRLHEMGHEHAKPRVSTQVDVELETLLIVRKNTSDLKTKQKLGRTIWQRDSEPSVNWKMLAETNVAHSKHVAACISIGPRLLVQTVTLQSSSLITALVCTSCLLSNGRKKKRPKRSVLQSGKRTSRQVHSPCTSRPTS